jgi:iron complex transport system substrate-binding protein
VRIVSLVPAATEIACALGAGPDLVAVTHDCDFPPEVRALPRVTRSTIAPGSTSREIDDAVREAQRRGESTFHLDGDALAAAKADVVLGQTLCEVCAVTLSQVPRAAAPVVPLDGGSLEGIFVDIARVGEALGRAREAAALVASLHARIERVRALVADAPRPRVACLEWLDPLFNAGHWVPEQVAHAGGEDVLGTAGVPSVDVPLERLIAADPDVIVLMPCGFDAERAVQEYPPLASDPRWRELRALRAGECYAVDGNAYFSRPGPRVVDGIELLASLLHPDRVRSRMRAIRMPQLQAGHVG